MRKSIKKYGNSLIVCFTKEDIFNYGIKQGDLIEMSFEKIEKPLTDNQVDDILREAQEGERV
jgi:hypothetical protein